MSESDERRETENRLEAQFLGAILIQQEDAPEALNRVLAAGLGPEHFYREQNRVLFSTMVELIERDEPIDQPSLLHELRRTDSLVRAGGALAVYDLGNEATPAFDFERNTIKLIEISDQRRAQSFLRGLQDGVGKLEGEADPFEYIKARIQEMEGSSRADFIPWHTGADYMTTPAPEQPALITVQDNVWMPRGRACMLAGPGGVGKTRLLMQLAIAVASGGKFIDPLYIEQPGHVLIACGEEGPEDMHRRIQEVCGTKSEVPTWEPQMHLWPLWGQECTLTTSSSRYGVTSTRPSAWYLKLKRSLMSAGHKWSLIILDPATRFMGADVETDNKAATEWVRLLENLARTVPGNPTVLIAHHVNKAALRAERGTDQGAARGSSALTDGVRWQANLESKKDDSSNRTITLRVVKNSYGPPAEPIDLRRGKGGVLAPTFLEQVNESKGRNSV